MRKARANEKFNNTALCLGNFDGVHLAHRILIERTRDSGEKSVVYTFNPHPLKALGYPFMSLNTWEDKESLMEKINPDILFEAEPTEELLSMDREAFVKDILVGRFGVKKVFMGFNSSFGKNGEGNALYLKEIGEALGFEVEILEEIKKDGKLVSSSNIRDYIRQGDFISANALLGHAHFYSGIVEKCKGLGRLLGFPTANIFPQKDLVLPPYGVYAMKIKADGFTFDGVGNVGVNPTVECGSIPKIEAHLFDFSGDLYGKRIEVELYGKIRGEEKFASERELKDKIEKDVINAKKCLTNL